MNISDLLTAGAVLVALVTWLLTFRHTRRSEMVTRTAEVIANLSVSEALAEATYQVTKLINEGKRIQYASISESLERHVVKILDYYEYICELFDSGILSRETVVALRGQLMVRTYDACEDYIEGTRNRQHRRIYSSFESFTQDLRASNPAINPG